MKLKNLHIDSYKMFHDFDMDFCSDSSPADIIVIAGVNGTGKTTLLKEMLNHGRKEYIPSVKDGSVTFVSFRFPKGETESTPKFTFTYREELIYFPAIDIGLDNLTASITRYVDKIIYEEGKSGAEAYQKVRQLIDLIFEDFHLGTQFYGMNRDRQLVFTNSQGNQFGVEGLSGGERQLLGKVFPLFMDELSGKIILMDEPEESLHPSWQSSLVPVLRRCAKENDCQFILATHSPQIISSVHTEELRLLIRTEDNNIKCITIDEGPYGWTVDKVLSEIQDVTHTRVPEIEEKLNRLSNQISSGEYKSENFAILWQEMEETLGYADNDLVLMRMEMIRKKKKDEAN